MTGSCNGAFKILRAMRTAVMVGEVASSESAPRQEHSHVLNFGLTVLTISMFEHAVSLARGVEDIDTPSTTTVPIADIRAAHDIAVEVDEYMRWLLQRFDRGGIPDLPAFGAVFMRDMLGRAGDAARRLEIETRVTLDRKPNALGEVRSLYGGIIERGVREMRVAREIMEIIAGERTVAESIFAGMDEAIGEAILVSIPYIGEGVLIYEAVAGRTLIGGRKMSQAERAITGIALILPYALAGVGKVVAQGAKRVGSITRRTILIALEYQRVFKLLETAKRLPHAMNIAIGMRRLSQATCRIGMMQRAAIGSVD